jgi:hypothetical protein
MISLLICRDETMQTFICSFFYILRFWNFNFRAVENKFALCLDYYVNADKCPTRLLHGRQYCGTPWTTLNSP